MWRQNQIPLVDFYELCKRNSGRFGYKLLICLVSRKAEAPLIFNELRQFWSSFHDVTGSEIIFMFAGDDLHKLPNSSDVLYIDHFAKSGHYSYPVREEVYNNNAKLAGARLDMGYLSGSYLSNIKRGTPRIERNEDFEEQHTLEISSLAKHIGIQERDIPSLSIIYLPLQLSLSIKLDPSSQLYPLIKEISTVFYQSEIGKIAMSEIIHEKQRIQNLTQKKQSLINKIIQHNSSYKGVQNFLFKWTASWKEKIPFKSNKKIIDAIKVIIKFPDHSDIIVFEALNILKEELPKTKRYSRTISFADRYFKKYFTKRASPIPDNRLEIYQREVEKLKELEVSSKYYNLFYDFSNQIISLNKPIFSDNEKIKIIRNALSECDIPKFINVLKSVFSGLSYNMKIQEGYFHSLIHMAMDFSGFRVISEKETNIGRIDLVTETEKYIYIMEFKLDTAAAALKQIKEKKYFEQYLSSNRKIILLGVSFDVSNKNISDYLYEELIF